MRDSTHVSVVHHVARTILLALAAGITFAPPDARASVMRLTGFTAVAVTPSSQERPDINNVRDGDLSTKSFLTIGFTTGVMTAYFDLGGAKDIMGFRWLKASSNVDGTGAAVDPMDLVFRATTDSTGTGLTSRTYANVTGLTNGFEGTELLQFGSGGGINAGTATALRENGAGVDDGQTEAQSFYTVTFDPILGATAIQMEFQPDDLGITPYTHYLTYEFYALTLPEPAGLLTLVLPMLVMRRRNRRGTGFQPVCAM